MKLKISKKELLTPLKILNSVIEQRTTLPILGNVLFEVAGNNLKLTGSDNEIEMCCKLMTSGGEDGEVTIPAKKLFSIIKSAEDADILIESTDDNISIKYGSSKFNLHTLPADDFPNTPELKEPVKLKISKNMLKKAIAKTSFCIATNDVRYYLTGLLLEIGDGKISLVCTDGHRMAVTQHDFESTQTARVIIPRKAVHELSKLLTDDDTDVFVIFDDNHIQFKINDSLTIVSKLIDGEFPDWTKIVPITANKIELLCTERVKQMITRATILSNEKYKGVKLSFRSDSLHVSGKNSNNEEGSDKIDVNYSYNDLDIGFNGVYLLDALNHISGENVQFYFLDNNSSCLITEDGSDVSRFIIMPMRL